MEQFYLFWPLLIIFSPRPQLRRLLIGLISLALAGAPYKLVFTSLWGCLDSLGLGALLAVTWHGSGRRTEVLRRFVRAGKMAGLLWAVMTVVRIGTGIDPSYEGYRWFGVAYFAAAAVAFTGLTAFAASGTKGLMGRRLESRPMVRIGRISYGLYVYDFFFAYILLWMVEQQYLRLTSPWHYAGLGIAGSVLVASLSWWLVEKPTLGLKRHFPQAA